MPATNCRIVKCVHHVMTDGESCCFLQFNRKPPEAVYNVLKDLSAHYRKAPHTFSTPTNRGGWYAAFDQMPDLCRKLTKLWPELAKQMATVGKQIETAHRTAIAHHTTAGKPNAHKLSYTNINVMR